MVVLSGANAKPGTLSRAIMMENGSWCSKRKWNTLGKGSQNGRERARENVWKWIRSTAAIKWAQIVPFSHHHRSHLVYYRCRLPTSKWKHSVLLNSYELSKKKGTARRRHSSSCFISGSYQDGKRNKLCIQKCQTEAKAINHKFNNQLQIITRIFNANYAESGNTEMCVTKKHLRSIRTAAYHNQTHFTESFFIHARTHYSFATFFLSRWIILWIRWFPQPKCLQLLTWTSKSSVELFPFFHFGLWTRCPCYVCLGEKNSGTRLNNWIGCLFRKKDIKFVDIVQMGAAQTMQMAEWHKSKMSLTVCRHFDIESKHQNTHIRI